MAVDEFGRTVQEGDEPSQLHQPLSSSRYESNNNRSQHSNYHHHHNSDRRSDYRHSDRPPHKRRLESSSPHDESPPDPSVAYASEPMLCLQLWKEDHPGSEAEYDDYRKEYCLNYVRTFFNQHLDDSWFRNLYSPLAKYRMAEQERKRAAMEAEAFGSQLKASLDRDSGHGPCMFVLQARLGNGVKQSNDHHRRALQNQLPKTHLFSSKVLPMERVPPKVTDEQITLTLLQNAGSIKPSDIALYSSTVVSGNNLLRTAYICCNETVQKEIIQKLNREAPPPTNSDSVTAHVPRKEETMVPPTLPLDVDCSDAYGRAQLDVDQRGGGEEGDAIPPRSETLLISTQDKTTPPVAVLSMALSSRERIPKDLEAARQLAKAYDLRKDIPADSQLETLLPKALPDLESGEPQVLEDALDVTIAYLRRVHLLSFYNGCAPATSVADVLCGNHGSSTVHLRLQASELVPPPAPAPVEEGEGAEPEPKTVDLLVQRLDTSISNAIQETEPWVEDPGQWKQVMVNPETDAAAKQLERDEAQVEGGWIERHSLDDDGSGRARCSFSFCRKLFKDFNFLQKHLLKKHGEFLRAEQAACHDASMMAAWDAQEQRPVPPILVNCGLRFGIRNSPVLGAATPLAEDPEPELWRRAEERREQQERESQQQRRWKSEDSNRPPPSRFVDVDDMKEEKVELNLEEINVAVQPPKKKKRKKLL
eukprot:Nitzschia sp. Nitz4//scaffold91_size79674//31209//33323//NITZ4_005365-RA/size79674-processed-gene-0.106-mRNA-1//-1//CDS//3329560094//5063//frame0